MQQESLTTIDLLRHGKPMGGNLYRGSTDDALSEQGWMQMHDALGEHTPWSKVLSSPLKRCVDFAQKWCLTHNTAIEILPAFKEIHFGDWEGKGYEEIIEIDQVRFSQHMHDPLNNPPPNGELLIDFSNRVIDAWQLLQNSLIGKHVLIVTHGGVIRIILHHILQTPLNVIMRIAVPYANLTRISISHSPKGGIHPSLIFHSGRL